MAFSFTSLSKSLSTLFSPQSPLPNSPSFIVPATTTLKVPQKASSAFASLVSTWDPKSTSASTTCFSSALTTADEEIKAVTCPSLAYSNTLFYKSGYYNVQVVVAENEPEEKLLSRFRRAVLKAGVIQECKRRRFFESSQDKKKRKVREASKRNRKRRPQPKVSAQAKEENPKKKVDDEDDNWELPEGDLPH